jgi:hypothetical protein
VQPFHSGNQRVRGGEATNSDPRLYRKLTVPTQFVYTERTFCPAPNYREKKAMKHLRLWVKAGIFGLLAALGSVALLHAQNAGDQGSSGASYLTTVKNSSGNFASRGVITLHTDHTMSVIDSGQGGPTFFFTSQLGSWKWNPSPSGGIVARTIDFDFPPSADVARLDYTISFSSDGSNVTGTIRLTTFPLNGNPLDGGGTVTGTFTFAGELIQP